MLNFLNNLDENLGVDGWIDSFVQSTASSDNIAIAGGVTVLSLDNVSEAYIDKSANINQDIKLRNDQQTVNVEAFSTNEAVNLIGKIELPNIKNKVINTAEDSIKEVKFDKDKLKQVLVPAGGTEGGKGAVGASVFVADYTNQVKATIAEDVTLYADSLKVEAKTKGMNVTMGASGSSGGTFAANGTVVVTLVNNKTNAQIKDGANLTIGDNLVKDSDASLVIAANDETQNINLIGGIATGNNIGIGASVGFTDINREVNAFIGSDMYPDSDSNTNSTPRTDTLIKTKGKIAIDAKAEGDIFTLSLAAAAVNEKKTKDTNGSSNYDSLANPALASANKETASNDKGNQGSYGVAVSGDVSVNDIDDKVRAYINDGGKITNQEGATPQDIEIKAFNNTSLIALSGSAAIVTKPEGNSVGLAGSVSINLLDGETKSFVTGKSNIEARNLSLDAQRDGDIVSLSAAAAATKSQTSVAVAGSVSINYLSDETKAYIDDAIVDLTGNLDNEAKNDLDITAIGGSAAYGGKTGVGSAIAVNLIVGSTIHANVSNTQLNILGNLTLDSNNNADIRAFSASVGASKVFGGAGTISVNIIDTDTNAFLSQIKGIDRETGEVDGNITITSDNDSDIFSLSGAVGAGKVGLGAAVAYNQISGHTKAYIDNGRFTSQGKLELKANTNRTISTLSLGVGGGKKVGLAGSVSLNIIWGDTDAYIKNSTVTTSEMIELAGDDDSDITSIAGQASGAGNTAVGAAVATNILNNEVNAYVSGSVVTSENSAVEVKTNFDSDVVNITVGGAGAGTFAGGGSVSTNVIKTQGRAYISDGSTVKASGSISVTSDDNSAIISIAGQANGAGTVAVGAAVATNTLNNEVYAYIRGSTVTSQNNDVEVKTAMKPTVVNITVGGAGAGTFAGGGSVSTNVIHTEAKTYISDSSTVKASGLISVTADDDSDITSIAGQANGAGTAAVGAAVATNILNNEVEAYVSGSVVTSDNSDIKVKTILDSDVVNITVGGAGAGTFAGGGSVSTNVINTEGKAYINNSSTVKASGLISVTADDNSDIISIAGQVNGAGTVAFGAAVATNILTNEVDAYISSSVVTSDNNGVEVKTAMKPKVVNITVGGAGAGTFAGGGSVSTNVINTEARAYIRDNSTVKASGLISVTADDDSDITSIAGQANGAGTAAVGAAVATNILNNEVETYVSGSVVTSDNSDIKVKTILDSDVVNITVGGAGAGTFAGGGSVSTNVINTEGKAYIDNSSTVKASGLISVTADDNSDIISIAGQVNGAGTVAFGAAVATNILTNEVDAYISGSTVTSDNNGVEVKTTIKPTVVNITAGGAGAGTFAGGGSVSTNAINTEARAYIRENSTVKASGLISVTTDDDSATSDSDDLKLQIGTFARLGSAPTDRTNYKTKASELISVVKDDNSISTDQIKTKIKGNITNYKTKASELISDATDDSGIISGIISIAGQANISGGGAIGASVATNIFTNKVEAYISGSTVTSDNNAVEVTTKIKPKVLNVTVGGAGAGAFAAGGSVSTNVINTENQAYIADSSTVKASESISVTADDDLDITSIAGQANLSGGGAIGAAVAVNNSNNTTKAYIDGSNTTSTSGTVKVSAKGTGTIESLSAGASVTTFVALTGSVSVNNITNTIEAYTKNATISAKNLDILAKDTATIKSGAGQLSVAIKGGAVGAAVAYNNIGNKVKAYSENSDINTAGNVQLSAAGKGTIETIAAGGSAGLFVGAAGSVAVNEIGNDVGAYIQGGNVTAQGSVGVLAESSNSITIKGGAIGLGLVGVGGTVVVNNLDNTTQAYLSGANVNALGNNSLTVPKADGSGNTEQMRGLAVIATSDNDLDLLIGTASVGAVGLAATIAVNSLNDTTKSYINGGTINGNNVRANSEQSVLVKAFNNSKIKVKAGTGAAGAGGIGATVDVNTVKNSTSAYINNATVNALKNVNAEAKAKKDVDSTVVAGTLGLGFGVSGAVSVVNISAGMTDEALKATDDTKGIVSQILSELENMGKTTVADISAQIKSEILEIAKDTKNNVTQILSELDNTGETTVADISAQIKDKIVKTAKDTKDKVSQKLSELVNVGKDSFLKSNIKTKKDILNDLSSNSSPIQGTTAYISGTINAGGSINVVSDETTGLDITSGAVALGGFLGVGGSVGIANITHQTSAYVGENANLTAGGNISVSTNGLIDNNKVQAIAGAGGAVGLGAAVSYLTTKNNTSAYIGTGTTINQANNVNVLAGSSSNLEAEGWGAAAGAAAAGVVIANAKESGTTEAYLGNGVKIENANNLNVKATAKQAVSAVGQAAAGGIVSGSGSIPTATVSPTVKAYIGDSSNIQVNNDVEVISDVTVDGDAEAKGVSIGAVAVGASIAKVNAKPNIDTYIGSNAVINAKNITVESLLGEPIKVPDTSFNPGNAVNTNQNTVTFRDNHDLDTGDSLVYSNGGGSNIGGLQNENSYNVIRVDGKTVKLGSEFDAAQVDAKFNTIKFSGNHGFKDGDEVVYQAKGGSAIGGLVSDRKYYVRVIDSNTIKLSTNSSYSANIQGTKLEKIDTTRIETNINIENHGFQNNDVINYQRRSAQFNVVKEISQDAKVENNIFNLSNDIASNDTIKSASHGFETNDKIIYSTTGTVLGGLENGKEYYVIKVDDNNFKLSTELSTSEEEAPAIDITSAKIDTSHKITAVGLKIQEVEKFDFTYTNNTITLNNHGFTDGQEVVYQTDGNALDGLTVGETYYIKKVDDNKFQLLETQNGTAIDFGANNDKHQLIVKKGVQGLEEGVSYYVISEDENNFKLSSTKDGTALTLSKEHLKGTGFNHLFTKDDVIDLTSASTGKHNFHIDLTSKGSGDKHILSAGASATVPSQGDNKFSVYAQASAGALIGGNATRADLDITPTMKTYVGNQASITATGNVKITSLSSVEATGTSNSKIAGAIAVGSSKIGANINNKNNTYVDSGVKITADGNVDITGQSDQTLNISSYGGAGSAITFADADAHATLTHNTDTKINNGANIISNDTLTVRSSSNTNGNVKVKADGVGAYADADADSSIKFDGSNDTTVNGRLEARRLNVEAIVDTLKVESRSESYGAGAIGNIDAKAKVDLSGSDAVVNIGSGAYLKGDYVTLDAKYKTVRSNAIALADCDGLGGDTDTDATNIMPIEAKVLTNSNSTLEVYELDVIADLENFNRTTTAKSDKALSIRIPLPFGKSITITMDFGSEEKRERYEPKPVIDFNSNVILDRRDVNPVLIIDQNGNIAQKSENITINNTNTEIIVNDIDNVKVGGINFIIPRRAGEAFNNGSFTDRGKYTVKDPAYETVQITNNSNKDLVVNDISVINIVGLPEIEYNQVNVNNKTINTTNVSPQSPLAVNPTIVTIENNNSNSKLVLQGIIDSPHDRTELVSKGGIIGRDGHKIITRNLSLTAENGSIGTDSQRIVAQINQGYDPVTEDVPSNNINLQIEAKGSVFLDLTAKQIDNNPVNVNVEKMTATQGDVNLLINQTTNSLDTAVSALYEFNKIISGNDIIINAGTTSTNIKGNTDFVENTSFLDDEALTNIDGNTADIKGLLDVVTGGSINLTEVNGGLNLKQVVSANEDIQITVIETEKLGEDLLLIDNAKVSAAKDITLLIGDDFQINSTAQIKSDQKVVIKADYNTQDTDGSLVNIFGAIYSQWTELYTEKDFDTFNVRRIDSKTYLRSRSGDDTINVGSKYPTSAGLLDDIDATLTISGGIGYDILNVDDSGDNTNNIAILNDTQINGLGMNGEINYGSFEKLNLKLGSGSDILAVESTHDGETDINTGEGNENVYVEAIYGKTTVRTSSGDDNIIVSNPEQMLDDISARLTLSGGTGNDNLSVDDSGDTTNNIAILNDTQINGLGMNGEINYGSFEKLNLKLGSGSDILAVESTHDGETDINTGEGNENVYVEAIYGKTTVRTSSGDDNITVSNSEQMLDDISARLTLSGGTGNDNLSVDDSGDTTNNIAILNDTQINGLGMNGEINYGSFEKLNLKLGSGSDILAVESTHDGETDINTGEGNENVYVEAIYGKTTVRTSSGDDNITVSNSEQMLDDISARLTLSGGTGNDNLSVDDSGDTTNNIAILNDTQINGLGMNGEINYGSFEKLNLKLGSGSDILAVESTHDGETDINTGEGNENVYVEAIYGKTTVRTSSGDDNIIVSNPEQMLDDISARLTLSGGTGNDNLSVDDSGDTTNNIAILNDTQINGLGMNGEINYGSFEKLNLKLGSGSDILAVESTHDGETDINTGEGNENVYVEAIYGKTTVRTSSGDDNITVSNSEQMLDDISARLTLSGGTGNDNLSVDDSGDTTNNIAILNDTQINGLGMNGEINYGSFEKLNLKLGSGSDILAVESTHDGETDINTGEGNDNVYIEAIYGDTTVLTGKEDDTVNVGESSLLAATLIVDGEKRRN